MFWNMNQRCAAHEVSQKSRESEVTRRTGDFESGEILKILPVDSSTTEDIHHIVDERSSMPFSRNRDISDAREFRPKLRIRVVAPGIVVVILSIRSSEDVDAVAVSDGRVSGSFRRGDCLRSVVDE